MEYHQKTSAVSKAETASLKALLLVMLVDKPSGRVSLGEALNSDYLKRWAEPALVEALEEGLPKLEVPPWHDDHLGSGQVVLPAPSHR